MLGRLNQDAIAAVSLANQVSFVMSLFSGAVTGSMSVLIAQYLGKRDTVNARRFLAMAVRYAAGISVVFFLLAFFFPRQIMGIFTPEKALIDVGAGYLRIVSFSYLFSGVSQCFLMMMKTAGAARMSVKISAVTVAVDMAADVFLIYGVGSFRGLGANGSAWSTVAVEMIALAWCLLWARKREDVRLDRGTILFFSRAYERDAWRVIPGMLASSLSWGLSITVHAFILGHLGRDAAAASSVTSVVQQLIQCLTAGLSAAVGVMIGKTLGQNDLEKARRYGKRAWRVALVSGLINMGLISAVGPLAYLMYKLEPQAKTYLIQMLAFHVLYMFAYAYNTVFTVGVFPAGGDSKYDAISVFFATWCFAIPLAMLGHFAFHWPVMLVYVVMCLDEIGKVPFIKRRYDQYIWVKNLTRGNAEDGAAGPAA